MRRVALLIVVLAVALALSMVAGALAQTRASFASAEQARSGAVVPSKRAAKWWTLREVGREIHELTFLAPRNRTLTASCTKLEKRLYRCDWHGVSWVSETLRNEANRHSDWFGRAKVRFHSNAVDVTLYQVKCIPSPELVRLGLTNTAC